MDIFNRPPAISEDMLQYAIYPPANTADKSSVTSLAALVDSLVQSLLPDHIWHRDAFELKSVPNPDLKDKWILEGRMRVGDSVDDEWCVVWLLREVSRKWDVAVSVFDSDGEFLLIEAAECLPSWVTPTNAENRVWIYRSKLHLIPLSHLSPPSSRPRTRRKYGGHESDEGEDIGDDEGDCWLSTHDALKAVMSSESTEASDDVQEAVWKRISGYPGSARQHIHIAKAFLPVDIAKAVSQDPSLVQKATETFYTRDALQLRAVHRMSRFPPQPSALTPLRMTRTAYAQLTGQKFHPPKIFGQFKERENTSEWRWRDIGMKIACGFEMLYQESKSRAEVRSAEALNDSTKAQKDALKRNVEYAEYLRKLSLFGYFKGELEGSKLWNELEDKAVKTFVNLRRDDDASRPPFANLVNAAIARAGEHPVVPELEEDSDDWLNVDAENFDEKLAETMRSGTAKSKEEGRRDDVMDVERSKDGEDDESRLAKAQADKLQGLAKKIEKFVEGEGTLEGAVLDDDEMSEDEQLSDFSDEEFPTDSDEESARIADDRVDAANVARQKAMDRLVPGLDPEEYGKMPASFYSNSQKVTPSTIETETMDKLPTKPTKISSEVAPPEKPVRRPILPRDDFDGVDSDDETDEEEVADDESEDDKPQIVGEIEIDMNEEQDEFLSFTREALGITDEMWSDIVRERQDRGAFVPQGAETIHSHSKGQAKGRNQDSGLRSPQAGPRPNVNPNLDSFEAVMEAMEAELTKARVVKKPFSPSVKNKTPSDSKPTPNTSKKGKEKATQLPGDAGDELEDNELEVAMEAELRAALEKEEGDSGDEEPMDYGLIKNFLESFKSQGGLSGPVSNLAGLLEPGWKLPRDST